MAFFFFFHLVVKSRPTLWDSMDCSTPGSSVHGIFQARILEWVAISFSRGSSWPRDRTCGSGRIFCLQVDSLLLNHWGSPIPNVCYAFKIINKMDKKNMYSILIRCQALCYVKQPCEIGSDTCPIGQMGKQRQEWVVNFLKVTQLVNGCAGISWVTEYIVAELLWINNTFK